MHTALGILCNNRSNMFSEEALAYRKARDAKDGGLGRAFEGSNFNHIDLGTINSLMLVSRGISSVAKMEFIANGEIGFLDFREDFETLKLKVDFAIANSIPIGVRLNVCNLANYIEAFDKEEYLSIIALIVRYDIDLMRVKERDYSKIRCWNRSSIRELRINYTGLINSDRLRFKNFDFNFKITECLDKVEISGNLVTKAIPQDSEFEGSNYYDLQVRLRSFKSNSKVTSLNIHKVNDKQLDNSSLFHLEVKHNKGKLLSSRELYLSRVSVNSNFESEFSPDSDRACTSKLKKSPSRRRTVSFEKTSEDNLKQRSAFRTRNPKIHATI